MKQITQVFLVVCGFIGLLVTIPAAFFGWSMHRGFGGDLTNKDWLLLYGPCFCLGALIAGVLWIRHDKRREPRRSPGAFTEDGGASGDPGGI